jgi:hypothetical protein
VAFIATAALAVGVVGLGVSYMGNKQQAAGQQASLEFQQQGQVLQQQQNQVNATRQQRQMIREGIVARANATTTSTNQGSQLGSGLEGALAQDSAQVASNVGAVGQNVAFGNASLALKRQSTNALQDAAAGGAMASLGSGLSSLGGGILKNAGQIERIGSQINKSLFA